MKFNVKNVKKFNLKKIFPNLRFKIKPRDITKPSRGTLSITKAKKLLNFNPKHNLKIGVKKYVQYLINNKIYK
jgi:nucleoside-diphosphate-sugar epimerase